MEPNDGRRLPLDLDPSGVLQGEGDESREWHGSQPGPVVKSGILGLLCEGGIVIDSMVRESGPSIKGPRYTID